MAGVYTQSCRWDSFYGIARVFPNANQHEQARLFNLRKIDVHPLIHLGYVQNQRSARVS